MSFYLKQIFFINTKSEGRAHIARSFQTAYTVATPISFSTISPNPTRKGALRCAISNISPSNTVSRL